VKAVILVGGEGTRMRPLTCNVPKPMIPVVNRPFMDHVVGLLTRHGITEIILAIQYLSSSFEQHYRDGSQLGVSFVQVREDKPLGTAGAVKNVEAHLSDTFVVFNGDIMTDLDLSAMLRFHRAKKSKVTIALTPVDDPTAYGLVELQPGGRIRRFLEKPRWEDVTSNLINAGTYIIEPEVLRYAPPGEFYMFERGLFPTLLEEGQPMFGFPSDSYWMDIGTPQKYLSVHRDVLAGRIACDLPGQEITEGVRVGEGCNIASSARIVGPVIFGDACSVGHDVHIFGPVVLGRECEISSSAVVEDSVMWDHVKLGSASSVKGSVVATGSRVEDAVTIDGGVVVGHNCGIGSGNKLANGMRVWPDTNLPPRSISF
jgi:mannose-1-phosphate guanylyltransferase